MLYDQSEYVMCEVMYKLYEYIMHNNQNKLKLLLFLDCIYNCITWLTNVNMFRVTCKYEMLFKYVLYIFGIIINFVLPTQEYTNQPAKHNKQHSWYGLSVSFVTPPLFKKRTKHLNHFDPGKAIWICDSTPLFQIWNWKLVV